MINILWTGGWDSTFRVLQASLTQKLEVQPHYVVDPERPGSQMELDAIATISRRANARGALILPLICINKADIPERQAITQALLEMRGEDNVGLQYDWLARYADTLGSPIELAIHKDDKAHALLAGQDPAQNAVFRYFQFPVFDMTKVEMQSIARREGFLDLLELSWFCHRPIHGRSCGVCGPCCYTRDEGLGHRISWEGRLREKYRAVKRRFGL